MFERKKKLFEKKGKDVPQVKIIMNLKTKFC
jgi:hypothetical protein